MEHETKGPALLQRAKEYLRTYDGPPLRLMEVCGTHTAQIERNGIPSLLSPRIQAIAGPGCPVCVTVTAVIDRLIELAGEKDTTVVSFGDLLRVPGSRGSLASARAAGASVAYVYAPSDALALAEADPGRQFVFAAVGFETTAPVYAMLLEEASARGIRNLRLLTSLKTMPAAIRRVARLADREGRGIDGFLAPGHVCAVVGTDDYEDLARELGIPFVVSGFQGPELLCALYALVRLRGQGAMRNLYPSVVRPAGNPRAVSAVERYFRRADAAWRGLGTIPGSGLVLREEYAAFDMGSEGLSEDRNPAGCRCGEVLTGAIAPTTCPMFGTSCTPEHPNGACMVSAEGSCYSRFRGGAAIP